MASRSSSRLQLAAIAGLHRQCRQLYVAAIPWVPKLGPFRCGIALCGKHVLPNQGPAQLMGPLLVNRSASWPRSGTFHGLLPPACVCPLPSDWTGLSLVNPYWPAPRNLDPEEGILRAPASCNCPWSPGYSIITPFIFCDQLFASVSGKPLRISRAMRTVSYLSLYKIHTQCQLPGIIRLISGKFLICKGRYWE